MVLLANGQVVSEAPGLELRHTVRGEAGAYRVEVRVPSSGGGDRSLPWIVGNPVYVVDPETTVVPPPPLPPAAVSPLSTTDLASQLRWSTESDATSEVEIDALGVESDGADGDSGFELRYRLGDDMDGGTYVAAVYPVEEGALARFDRVAFRAAADRPHRVSVQMRAGGLVGQPRWRTSAYIGPSVTEVQIPFGHVVSVEPSGSPLSFEPSQIDAILLVIDLTNSSPEAVGELTVRDVRLER